LSAADDAAVSVKSQVLRARVTVDKSPYHKFALSFRLSGEQKAQSCDNAWLQQLSTIAVFPP
jgi:hypothetical protein